MINSTSPRQRSRSLLILPLLIAVSLACSLPFFGQETPTPTIPAEIETQVVTPSSPATPTPTPQPLPPQLVEVNPPPGAELPVQGEITLYFNQPMDRSSVEAALSGHPLSLDWKDDATLGILPERPFTPASKLDLKLASSAQAANGLSFSEAVDLNYQVIGYLQLIERLPEPSAVEIDPTSAVVATFNLPVVPLGTDSDSLPPAFTLSPQAEGRGEWLNTSTYVFFPEPALAGGVDYAVRLNADLVSAGGSSLENAESWSFSTASPRLVAIEPSPGSSDLNLDSEFVLTFNQPMNPDSLAENFALLDSNDDRVPGEIDWNDDLTEATFSPTNLLKRSQEYQLLLSEPAQSSGGTPLGQEIQEVFQTVQSLRVVSTEPFQGGRRNVFASVLIHFNAPINSRDIPQFITFSPEVPNLQAFTEEDRRNLRLIGDFAADTDYTLILSPNLPDAWGGRLGEEFSLDFHTLPLDPDIIVTTGSDVLFLTPQDSNLNAQVTNISEVSLSIGTLPIDTFIDMRAPNNFDLRQNYESEDQRSYQYTLTIAANRAQPVDIPLSLGSGSLRPGLYYVRFDLQSDRIYPGPFLLVVSNIHLTFKMSATDALVWVVDLRDGRPLAEAPISIYAEDGAVLAQGRTDENGILRTSISDLDDVFSTSYAALGQPGDENFAMALSTWNQGVEGWSFAIPTNYAPPHLQAYLYTDRPIYRPGQTVYFRVIARQAYNGRYALPEQATLPLALFSELGEEVSSFELRFSDFGTAHGSYTLPVDAAPGIYNLTSQAASFSTVSFQVAEFRKPEIDLQVSFTSDQVLSSAPLLADVQARYFFDAPAGNVPVKWQLFKERSTFNLPGYQVGTQETDWLLPLPGGFPAFGELVAEGEGETGPDGSLALEFAAAQEDSRQGYTLEATAEDESGIPVSARASLEVNPAEYYIGVRPDAWVGQAGGTTGFEVLVVDWSGKPAGSRALRADFHKVVWERVDPRPGDPLNLPSFEPQTTLVGSTDFVTSNEGIARLAFTPPEPGTYQLDVRGLHPEERTARTQINLWVGGPGQAIWPNLPNQRLRLTADQVSYLPDQTAQVFIPNPFEGSALALITVERGVILRHQMMVIEGAGKQIPLPLTDEDAPNVYVSVTLLERNASGTPDFRQGYVNLPVRPDAQTLNVALTSEPSRTGPGEPVRFDVRVTDAQDNPAVGEFSLAVVDRAVLALADPFSEDIVSAFYGVQPLGVQTGIAMAAHTRRRAVGPDGVGGGGGGEFIQPLFIREEFLDTALWQAEIVTNQNGEAQVSVTLPDNLTTWQADLRGLTADTRVGQAGTQIVTTKELLIRPVTPRFLVQGDHALMAAVVHNNTDRPLVVDVNLQATGFGLDEDSPAQQQVNVPAGGRQRVAWWGAALDTQSAELVFSARAGDLQDAARPEFGVLPVLSYTTAQTFATSGVMEEGGERLELVSLPRSFETQGGALSVELAPSLGAAMMDSFAALENFPYSCTEQVLSRFLPNLETYRVLQDFGLEAPNLQTRLDRTVDEGLTLLTERQNTDGGWGWWTGDESDSYVSTYVLFGLLRAREAGVSVGESLIQRAVDYLLASLPAPDMLTESWQFDRLAFQQYVLAQLDSADPAGIAALFEEREGLNPWAQAFLALSIQEIAPDDGRIRTLLSDLRSLAVRTGTGAHWEDQLPGYQNMSTPVFSSAIVLYALAQQDPASPLIAETVRYLMAHRGASGGWASTYETAWTLMALAKVMQGTGELGGDFGFSAALNGAPLVSGEAGGATQLTPVKGEAPIADLHPQAPNALVIEREAGEGRLYYRAHLRANRPVEDVGPADNGISVSRAYFPNGDACARGECDPIQQAEAGDLIDVRVTVTVPDSGYYLLVEDYIPAGAEVLDTSLKTSQQGAADYDPRDPFGEGWGWWYFGNPQIRADRIAWAADSLPPGTYELTYTLVILHPGEYRVLPARAWQFYFPEVQGNSAGEVFRIEE